MVALVTPSSSFSASSTCATQLAQVIPITGKVICFVFTLDS